MRRREQCALCARLAPTTQIVSRQTHCGHDAVAFGQSLATIAARLPTENLLERSWAERANKSTDIGKGAVQKRCGALSSRARARIDTMSGKAQRPPTNNDCESVNRKELSPKKELPSDVGDPCALSVQMTPNQVQ